MMVKMVKSASNLDITGYINSRCHRYHRYGSRLGTVRWESGQPENLQLCTA
jgi:hypothetical protein